MIGPDGIVRRQRLAAYAWCEDGDRVLLCRIAPGEADSGRWTLPGGGLEFGEDPADGVLRELDALPVVDLVGWARGRMGR